MTAMWAGRLILGLTDTSRTLNLHSRLIVEPSDKRLRQSTVTFYHDHIAKLINPRFVFKTWDPPACVFPNDTELAEISDSLQSQMSNLLTSSSDEAIFQEVPQAQNGVLGLYLGSWFPNPESDVNKENRLVRVLAGDCVYWVPIFEDTT